MSLENVLESIRERGDRKAEQIRSEAQEEAQRILDEAEEQAEAKVEEARERADADAEPLRRRELLSAEIEAKKERLEAQRGAMQSVRDRARELLGELPEGERLDLVEALVERVEAELEDPRIYAAERDAELVEKVAPERYAGTEPIWGGVVAESADGEVRVDYSLETILEEVWDDHVGQVSEVLEG